MGEHDIAPDLARRNMWKWKWRRRVALAQGLYPPQILLKGGRVLNVFTEELVEADVAIDAGYIAAIVDPASDDYPDGRETIDISGCIVAPSFIDAHIHTESSLLWLPEFVRTVVPHGTGAIVTDPHEMANVAGLPGIETLRAAAAGLPMDVHFTVPSSVPASPHETPGATFDEAAIVEMLNWPESVGLGELMDTTGLAAAESAIGDTIWASMGFLRDGHAPGLRGGALQAYVGSGIGADHESVTMAEAREKLELGMFLYLREGSSEKNLVELLPLVNDKTYPRIAFASDDRDASDLRTKGHVDDILRIAIAHGLDPIRAIRMATWNPANQWRLEGVGAVAPGYLANLVVLRDLETVNVAMTLHHGSVVAQDGAFTAEVAESALPEVLLHTINVAPVQLSHLRLPAEEGIRAVGIVPDQIVTTYETVEPTIVDGAAVADPERDLLKLVAVDRHHASGRIGVGYVRGLGLKRGAIASSVAHDAHNIIAAGATDVDILAAIATVAAMDGGMAVVADGDVQAALPLPIAGLMSAAPADSVAKDYAALEAAAKALDCPLTSPFGQLAFLSLSVIPEARVTDQGFLDLRSENGGATTED